MEKSSKTRKMRVAAAALLVTLAIAVNTACAAFYPAITAFMAANLNPLLSGRAGTQALNLSPEEAQQASREMARELAGEGIVLLENKNGALPLEQGTKVNLFGYATVDPLYGGTGSGAGDTSNNVDLIEGLTASGFEVNQELVNFYKNSGVKRPSQKGFVGANFTPVEVPAAQYDQQLLQSAKAFSDTALVMFSRTGGEGGDLPQDMYAAGYSDTDDGTHYLELTQDEKDLLELVKAQGFARVIVLINSSNAMELGFVQQDGVDAALWIGGPGSTGFEAVGQILSGAVTPSGRLTDTYAYDLTSSPAYWNAGSFAYSNLERNYVEYAEGIYVGYRFYETRWIDNATGLCDEEAYRKAVQYPFGYGLSYTEFEQSIQNFSADGKTIRMEVQVTNTGAVAGKDVVQVYYTAPYTVGGIEKSHVVLAGFGKTKLLEPGESDTVSVEFAVEDMASYDEKNGGSYVLEAGDYQIRPMKNAHEEIDQRVYSVEQTVVYGQDAPRSSDHQAAVNRFEDVSSGQITQYVSRWDWEGTLPTSRQDDKEASAETVAVFSSKPQPVLEDAEPIAFGQHGLVLEDMRGLDYDDAKWELLLEQLSVADMTNMIANGGWSTPQVDSVGKPATTDLDGPAGLNSLTSNLKGVPFPSQVLIGASWNTELVERFGQVFAAEAAANRVVGLYAPGANIHRTPFSGRNFEYYAEDGLLSGKLAAAMVKGCSSQGVYCYVKHFALNDQESDRLSISVWANEQSMRELYLKPFELAVKEGGTTAIMSSYNYLGNTWAGASYALLTQVLRQEWGFEGMVVTDSAMGNTSWMDVNLALPAGGDMMLCLMGVTLDSSTNAMQQAMRRACHNILYTQANSVAVSVAADNAPYWLMLLALVDGLIVSALVLLVLGGRTLKRRHKAGIVIGITVLAVLVALVLIMRGPSQPASQSSAADSIAASSDSASSAGSLPVEETPAEGVFLQLDGQGEGEQSWLKSHVTLNEDGSFALYWDYNAENSGIEGDKGSWEKLEDGSIRLSGQREFTATTQDGSTYALEILNEETGITCQLSGSLAGEASAAAPAEGVFLQLDGQGEGEQSWLKSHVTLNEDGSFALYWDYNAENSGIEGDKGSWEKLEDGSIRLSGQREFTATTQDGSTYALEILNEETGITCQLSGSLQ